MSALFLAVDGGQSGTVAVLADAAGTILSVGRGGPIRHHEELDAERLAYDSLGQAIAAAMTCYKDCTIAVCCLALTGSAELARRYINATLATDRLIVLESDTHAALASGAAGGGGIGVVAGTGTVAIAHGRAGDDVVGGGWGWVLGDEGSGFWIAMEALKASARDVDRTNRPTALTAALPGALGESDMRGVYNLVTGRRFDRTRIAALATQVVGIAQAGDAVATQILDRAADHLTELVVATASSAMFLEPDERVVVASGGVLAPGGWVATRLERNLVSRLPGFSFITPLVPPVVGAYYLALVADGIPVGEELQRHVANQVLSRPELASKASSHAL